MNSLKDWFLWQGMTIWWFNLIYVAYKLSDLRNENSWSNETSGILLFPWIADENVGAKKVSEWSRLYSQPVN